MGLRMYSLGGREGNEGWYAFANGIEADGMEFKEILLKLTTAIEASGFYITKLHHT